MPPATPPTCSPVSLLANSGMWQLFKPKFSHLCAASVVLLIDCCVIFGENPVKLASVLPKFLKLPSLITADHCSRGTVHRVLFIGTVHTPRVNN
ncbi:hypothetical protein SLEP1_g17485 [Rubroshorea leprosula]|uniref:Uncharacterized protein n=1 Tax=Rubroshorea leprosula TaxID=152421 RepID=A0AAV5J000_9ROSI|nr:hypothetical protein SLEP1_g17485 [Rubroshorea leprosula]